MSPISESFHPALPTLDNLKASISENVDAQKVAQDWLVQFASAIRSQDIPIILEMIHPDGWWRDLVALTWDLRTFHGSGTLKKFLEDRLPNSQFSVSQDVLMARLVKVYPDLQWIVTVFAFRTASGIGHMSAYLVPTSSGQWLAFILCTDLDGLEGAQEHYGAGRDSTLGRADVWLAERARELAFEDHSPEVLIVGAGQSGLALAARLRNVGVSTLIVEKNEHVGDQWRHRYESLRLHDFVWLNHSPYLKFPGSFPVHIPGKKMGDWFESYAKIMDLNIWTSTTVSHASQDSKTGKWSVNVTKEDGSKRVVQVDHVVFTTGWVGEPNVPKLPGREDFMGEVLHSAQYVNAKPFAGKKVIVVGACTSAHDIAADCAVQGIDVTMFQRSSTLMMRIEDLAKALKPLYSETGPPLELADRMSSSMPAMFRKLLGPREMKNIIEGDLERRQKLEQLGYRMNSGVDGNGPLWNIFTRGGGQYLDQGACDLILDGKIKIKSNTHIDRYIRTGLRFQDGTEIEADVIILATGYGDSRDPMKRVIGEEAGKKLTKVWGVNEEGELNSIAKETGIPNLWYLSGSLALSRIYSKHLALQIHAKQMGFTIDRYSARPVY